MTQELRGATGVTEAIAEAMPLRVRPRLASGEVALFSLLEAAHVVLLREGLIKFRTQAVASEAQVSIGTLYRYFPDRQALLASLGLLNADALTERFAHAFATRAESWPEIVDRITDVLSSAFASYPSMALIGIGSRPSIAAEPPTWTELAAPAVDSMWALGIPATASANAVATVCELVDAMLAVPGNDRLRSARLPSIRAAAQEIARVSLTDSTTDRKRGRLSGSVPRMSP